ncbi:MAG: hypothetical protein SCM11_01245 [Bacillota bacterium]|nr:hypothetical protein [Bacillota bacterium]
MAKHILSCKERRAAIERETNEKQTGFFVLLINDKYSKQYWLVVEMKDTASLKDLDQFLRDIWLECCGHLSDFEIEGVRYESSDQDSDEWMFPVKGMHIKLKKLLAPGMIFEHRYDYGSTTELTISVIAHQMGPAKKEQLTILSRNHPTTFICDKCGKKAATAICLECIYDGTGLLCDDCRQDHECGEDMLSEIYNSPRTGVCGYEGSYKYPD